MSGSRAESVSRTCFLSWQGEFPVDADGLERDENGHGRKGAESSGCGNIAVVGETTEVGMNARHAASRSVVLETN